MCYNSSNSYEHTIFQPITPFSRRKKKLLFLSLIERREEKKKETKKKRDLSIWTSQMNASNAYDALSPNRNECIVKREGMKGRECSRLEFPPFIGNVPAVSEGNGF